MFYKLKLTVNKQLATERAAHELIQYLNFVRSFSSKNNELHGAPQSFDTFPATFNSYPMTCGAFNWTGQMNPIERCEYPVVLFLYSVSPLLVFLSLFCRTETGVLKEFCSFLEDELLEMQSSSVSSSGNLSHSRFSGHMKLNVFIIFSQCRALSHNDRQGGIG